MALVGDTPYRLTPSCETLRCLTGKIDNSIIVIIVSFLLMCILAISQSGQLTCGMHSNSSCGLSCYDLGQVQCMGNNCTVDPSEMVTYGTSCINASECRGNMLIVLLYPGIYL